MNLGFEIAFDRPWFLLLLLILPIMWYWSFNSLAGLGKGRRIFALLLRSLVVLLMVMALAEAKWQRSTNRLTVIYLLDQSESIPVEKRERMLSYVFDEVVNHRREKEKDKAGVIVFGGNAKIESAPFDGQLPLIGKIESTLDLETSSTSLEAALKLAKASFPEDTARRVVIISDGNENNGDAMSIAQSMAEDGIGIDVVPVELVAQSEISVDKVVLPTDIRKGQKFESKVVLTNNTGGDKPVKGKLRVTRKTVTSSVVVAEPEVELVPGKNIFGFDSKLDAAGVFTTEAVFVPNDLSQDLITQNNRASAFTHVRGKGKVLLIEDKFHKNEFNNLINQLAKNDIETDTIGSDSLYTTAAELLQYDSVVLANLPRAAGGDGGSEIESFSDAQIKILVDNCEHMGCGIVMLGGDRAFGAGGWSNSLLEKAMPVDFQIKNDKVSAVGALALMMHASEMPRGNYWQSKIGEEAIKVLGPMDYCGVIDWSDMGGNPRWLWKLPTGVDRVYRNRNRMLGLVRKMAPGDMPDFNKPMRVMLNGLKKVNASMKHVIIISDGDPTPPSSALLNDFIKSKIKISTAAVGTHGAAGSTPLQKIAKVTGGQYYVVKNAKALPKIYQREARRVAKPVIKESESGMSLVPTSQTATHEIMKGINVEAFPPFYGYVMSTIKKSNLVQQLAIASEPQNDGGENSTVLAAWRYGNGRTVAFTSDAGFKWTTQWFNDEQYDKLFAQMVRYSMRPITESANFTVAAKAKDGMAQIVVTALDDDDNLLNFLEMSGRGINSAKTGDDDKGIELEFTQVAPGRYVAEHPIKGSGNLLYTIFPGEGYERLTAGINIPYSSEYSDRESNLALLESLSSFKPRGGKAGKIIEGSLSNAGISKLLESNTFRPTLSAAVGIRDIWPLLLVLCGVAFFADVFIRRVAVSFDWFFDFLNYLRSFFVKTEQEQRQASMSRLQSRKAEIERDIESRRASTKFEPSSDLETSTKRGSGKQRLEEVLASEIEKTPALPPKIVRDKLKDEQETSYTSRLLDAKRKVQKQRDRNKNPDEK